MRPSDEIEEVLRRFYVILSAGDADALAGLVTRDLDAFVGIGIDSDLESGAEWLAGFTEELRGEDAVTRTPGDAPHCYAEGTVGWFADRPTLTFPDGATVTPRLTGVLRFEDGDWRLVSLHASLEPSD
jgi:hypothetical protein